MAWHVGTYVGCFSLVVVVCVLRVYVFSLLLFVCNPTAHNRGGAGQQAEGLLVICNCAFQLWDYGRAAVGIPLVSFDN